MLEQIFLQILDMSFMASLVIPVVLLLRLALKKAPKNISYGLWSVVLFRLICSFSFESIFSLLPSAHPLPQDILMSTNPVINSGIPIIDQSISLPAPQIGDSINPMQVLVFIGAIIWLIGAILLFIYSVVTYFILQRKVTFALLLKDNIYECEKIYSPFVLGIIKPKIYLPTNLPEKEKNYILAHEQTHIKRFDTLIKPFAFLTLCVHWFNPLCWLSFILMSKDMELSCDEAVLKNMGSSIKGDYSMSLLSLSSPQKMLNGSPLAFGESNVKSRIKNVLNYKKPTFWVILVSVIAAITVGACLLVNPKETSSNIKHGGVNATILEIDYENVTMLVEGLDRDSVIGDRCFVTCKDAYIIRVVNSSPTDLNFEKLSVGDTITLDIDTVQESYPTSVVTTRIQLLSSAPFENFDSLAWAQALVEKDIASIELIVQPSAENQRYKKFSASEFADIVKLVNQSKGELLRYNESLSTPIQSLYIMLTDGQKHTLSNAANTFLVIDGQYYSDNYDYLLSWNFKGDSTVPESFYTDRPVDLTVVNPGELSGQAFVDAISDSFQIKEGVARFSLPHEAPSGYTLSQLSISVGGFMPMTSDSNMSLHAYEKENSEKNWQLGKEYIEKMFDGDISDNTQVYINVSLMEADGTGSFYHSGKELVFPLRDVGTVPTAKIATNGITFTDRFGDSLKLSLALPNGWRMQENAGDYTGHIAPKVGIYDGASLVGEIFCTSFELYRGDNGDIPYMSVYNGIMMGSGASWDGEYTEISKTQNTATGICKPWNRVVLPGVAGAAQANVENRGVLSYDAELLKYVGIFLNSQSVTDAQWLEIAKSVKIS